MTEHATLVHMDIDDPNSPDAARVAALEEALERARKAREHDRKALKEALERAREAEGLLKGAAREHLSNALDRMEQDEEIELLEHLLEEATERARKAERALKEAAREHLDRKEIDEIEHLEHLLEEATERARKAEEALEDLHQDLRLAEAWQAWLRAWPKR